MTKRPHMSRRRPSTGREDATSESRVMGGSWELGGDTPFEHRGDTWREDGMSAITHKARPACDPRRTCENRELAAGHPPLVPHDVSTTVITIRSLSSGVNAESWTGPSAVVVVARIW